MTINGPTDPIHVPSGFRWSATIAGIKVSGRPDVAFAEAPLGASAAAVFTQNRVCAAPVVVGKENLKATAGRVRAVIVNSGNANCATGKHGLLAAEDVCGAVGIRLEAAPEFVFPSSTGIIGVALPAEKIIAALPQVVARAESSEAAVTAFAQAIMTTDTRMKVASTHFRTSGKEVRVVGVAKGSGMIHPNLATMLVYIFTDVDASGAELKALLTKSVDTTFNCISVDGDTSTNDTVLLLASGASKVKLRTAKKQFAAALDGVCESLAEQIVTDGEGAKHVVQLHVEQASSVEEARVVARSIANSPLVKTAWAGCDPNWGRILSSVGKSGVEVDPSKINIKIGPQTVCKGGAAWAFDERAAHEYMRQPRYDIFIELGRGKASLRFLSCDLTTEYVHINADYST
jgi:glutamate N-acetyltransferase / amino-acid N-acetyltransferase